MGNNTNTLVALLAGAAIGAGLGILYAPASGRKTRGKIRHKFQGGKDQLLQQYEAVVGKFRGKASETAANLSDGIDHMIEEGRHTTEQAITALEEKLKKLKAEVKKA